MLNMLNIFPGRNQQNVFANWKKAIGCGVHLLVEGHYGKYFQNADDKQTQQQRRYIPWDAQFKGSPCFSNKIIFSKIRLRTGCSNP